MVTMENIKVGDRYVLEKNTSFYRERSITRDDAPPLMILIETPILIVIKYILPFDKFYTKIVFSENYDHEGFFWFYDNIEYPLPKFISSERSNPKVYNINQLKYILYPATEEIIEIINKIDETHNSYNIILYNYQQLLKDSISLLPKIAKDRELYKQEINNYIIETEQNGE